MLVLAGTAVLALAGSGAVAVATADARAERDRARLAFEDNVGALGAIETATGATRDTLARLRRDGRDAPADTQRYIVVSIAEHRLWYRQGRQVLFSTRVATGSGKVLESNGDGWKFETPRGRLIVQDKEQDPMWVPPDWHFVEQARTRGLRVLRLSGERAVRLADRSVITVQGSDVVRRYPDGRVTALEASEGREIVAAGSLIIPPIGTSQRRYAGVLGTHRLLLGDGYALHGTDHPETIGKSVSHGCVRLRNEDIETLYRIVPVGTPVFIY